MFDPKITIAIICAYMGLLFCIAHWGERRASAGKSAANNPVVYSLSLAVYCTAWTYYGSVGKAATSGWIFLTMYLGPTIGIFLWWTVLRKLVRIKNKHHITSIADFISARYGKSQTLAIMATIIAVVGITPYIALQLKAVTSTFYLITASGTAEDSWITQHMGFIVVGLMSLFAIMFGARRLDPTERHEGMVMALSVECVVKLVAFLIVGIFVTYIIYDGFGDIFQRFSESPMCKRIVIGQIQSTSYTEWITYLVLAMSGILFLPRQFHIAVVENSDEKHILKAMWLFPLYMFLINLFVMPIAMGGLLKGYTAQQADTFVLSLPLRHGGPWLALAVFLGGFSAATGMIMICSMTLATMLTNHLLLPFVEGIKNLWFLRRHLLRCRWVAITAIILMGYGFERNVGETYMLVSMGILSFAAVFQFAPSIIGGIFWPKGNKAGAIMGMGAGFFIWTYTLLLPSFVKSGWLSETLLKDGPWGIGFLKPEELFGLANLSPLNHGVFWSIFVNVGLYVAGSLYFAGSQEEQSMTKEFLDDLSIRSSSDLPIHGEAYIDLNNKKKEVENLLGQYFSGTEADIIITKCLQAAGAEEKSLISVAELVEFLKEIEISLAGSIGSAAAHRALRQGVVFDSREATELTAMYAQILQNLKLSPTELRTKIDYHQEREAMLACQATELELRVKERTQELTDANEALTNQIFERLRVEEALTESESRLRQLTDNIQEVLWMMDARSDKIIYVTPSYEKVYGLKQQGLYEDAESFRQVVQPDDLEKITDAAYAQAQGKSTETEYRIIKPDGQVRWILSRAFPVFDEAGEPCRIVGVASDITDRKRVEEERARLATAIEQIAEGVIITDANWIIQYANPAFERITGYGMEEIIGQHARFLKSNGQKAILLTELQKTLSRGEWWSGHLVNKKKDGAPYDAEVTASAVRDKSGATINYVSIHRDVTHELAAEKELQQAQKMEAIGKLAGGIAHDFNNILAAIMGYTELSLNKIPRQSPVRSNLEQVLKAASRASEVVKQILMFSRRSEQERNPVQIAPVVQEVLRLLRSSLPSTIQINHDTAIDLEDGTVLANPSQIHQVLMNLCTNASYAMRGKGGSLSVRISEIADSSLDSRLQDLNGGPYVCLSVSDTGTGMKAAVMEQIFDPYFTTKGPGEGTGLGLSVVQGIVKNHGGKITVNSEFGQGTTFCIFLPKLGKAASPEVEKVEQVANGSERILFVDDEVALVNLGKEMLEALGYHVTALSNSRDALETFRAQPDSFDLVITDLTMPVLTGRDLAKELMAIRADIPVVLCTGFGDQNAAKQAEGAGICDFIMKPYVCATLAGAIRKALGQR